MKSGSRRGAGIVAGLVLAAGLIAAAAHGLASRVADDGTRPGRLVRLPDGRRINLRCTGAGAPTVILEGGFAATSMGWYKVQPLVAKHHRACSYDRAGYGFSDPGPLPRDGAAVARDLDQALRAARIAGPFVVVGHSAGGLYVRLFADRRPKDVIGMVLVEPSVAHQDRRFAAFAGPGAGSLAPMSARAGRCLAAAERGALPSSDPALSSCTPPAKPGLSAAVIAARAAEWKKPAMWRTQVSELDTLWASTSDEIDAGRQDYGALPLIVLTAAESYAATPQPARQVIDAAWASWHREIAQRSTRGSAQRVEKSSHMMIFDRPDAIAAAIEAVINMPPAETKKSGPS